jgi:hypothetical protein
MQTDFDWYLTHCMSVQSYSYLYFVNIYSYVCEFQIIALSKLYIIYK